MDVLAHNRAAWNKQSQGGSRWCTPVTSAEIEAARRGEWTVILTPNKGVPKEWFGGIGGKELLCLASGGGQQAPILAAAGARVTSFDNSEEQLAKDEFVAKRDSLSLKTIRGDMADLSVFPNNSFDLIFHPVSNVFVKDVRPVWRECFRVLKNGGKLMAGFMNPIYFLFDHHEVNESGSFHAKYPLPYSDLESLPEERKRKITEDGLAFEFGHTLEDQLGGQTSAGFAITALYEDNWDDDSTPLNKLGSLFIATLARKLRIEPDAAGNACQPIRSKTQETSPAIGSHR